MAALARWCVRHRLVAVLLWLLAFGGLTAAAAVTGSAYSNDYEAPGTESGRAMQLLQDGFPGSGGDSDTVVWHTTSGTVRAADVEQTMTETLEQMSDLPGVASVVGPYDGQGAGRISADGHTAYATITFEDRAEDIKKSEVEAVVHTAEAARADGLQVELGGSAVALTESSGGHVAEIVGVAVAAVVLFLAFGSLAASMLPIATALVSVGTAYAAIVLLGHAMTVADFAPMLGMLIGLGVGIDYALFIVTRHRRGLKRGLSVTEAVTNAVATTGRAVVFAGATVCIALLGMLILRLSFLNGVAIAASLTVVLTVAASVTLLPALLSFIGPRALSRRERRHLEEHGPQPELPTGLAARWSAFVERHPAAGRRRAGRHDRPGAAHALPPPGHLRPGQRPRDVDHEAGVRPAGGRTRTGRERSADPGHARRRRRGQARPRQPRRHDPHHRGRRLGDPGDLQHRRRHRVLHDRPGVRAPVAEDQRSRRPAAHRGTAARRDRYIARRARRRCHGQLRRLRRRHRRQAALFVGVVIGLGCLLLLLAFRSIGIPVKAAAMNVAAVAAAFGVVVAIFQWGWGSELLGLGRAGPIEPFLPVIMVSVLFGLSMDYQVFLVSRMYEEWLETGDNRRAVRVGLAETSRVINSAAVIMISVFLAFVLSGDRVIAMFGIALASAVALDAFVLRTLLVPALMHMLGGANWWLPRWLDQRLPRISIEPPECRAAHERLAAATDAEVADVLAKGWEDDVRDISG